MWRSVAGSVGSGRLKRIDRSIERSPDQQMQSRVQWLCVGSGGGGRGGMMGGVGVGAASSGGEYTRLASAVIICP